jgi:hypothetical protein
MLRQIALGAVLFATPCAAQTMESQAAPEARAEAPARDDPFVVSGDECGASQYAHLIGEPLAEVIQTAFPSDTYVLGAARLTTLEYQPARLNVTLGGEGQILAIGCF